jgi:hypothetical protein
MKLVARIILLLFVSFLSMPTVISLIKKNANISLLFSFEDEESNKDLKEIKADFPNVFVSITSNFKQIMNTEIISENLSKHDTILEKIFSPPPELI